MIICPCLKLLRVLFSFHVIWEQIASPPGVLCLVLRVPFSCRRLFAR